MTKAKSKEEWIKAWTDEARHLTRAYQCNADPVIFDDLRFAIDAVVCVIETIGDRMESEGVWKAKGSCPKCGEELIFGECPNCFPSRRGGLNPKMKAIKRAYDEWIHCGNSGSIVEYCLKVGIKLEDME
jgi:hypothetical protein